MPRWRGQGHDSPPFPGPLRVAEQRLACVWHWFIGAARASCFLARIARPTGRRSRSMLLATCN
eukprot:5348357-Prymnesium_polylepis.1